MAIRIKSSNKIEKNKFYKGIGDLNAFIFTVKDCITGNAALMIAYIDGQGIKYDEFIAAQGSEERLVEIPQNEVPIWVRLIIYDNFAMCEQIGLSWGDIPKFDEASLFKKVQDSLDACRGRYLKFVCEQLFEQLTCAKLEKVFYVPAEPYPDLQARDAARIFKAVKALAKAYNEDNGKSAVCASNVLFQYEKLIEVLCDRRVDQMYIESLLNGAYCAYNLMKQVGVPSPFPYFQFDTIQVSQEDPFGANIKKVKF